MAQLIDELLSYFNAHSEELLREYDGKIIVLSKDKEISAFNDFETGYNYGVSKYGYGNFLLKECSRAAMNAVHVINPVVSVL